MGVVWQCVAKCMKTSYYLLDKSIMRAIQCLDFQKGHLKKYRSGGEKGPDLTVLSHGNDINLKKRR